MNFRQNPLRQFFNKSQQRQISGNNMTAITMSKYDPEVKKSWTISQVPIPKPMEGEVLVEIHSASINPLDLWMSRGYGGKLFSYQGIKPPYVVGRDGSGTIVKIGSGVWDWKVGDEVILCPAVFANKGTFAEYSVSSQFDIAKKPSNLSFQQAAAIPFTALTAWQAINGIKNGNKVLVHGAGGAVGFFVIHFLKNIMNCQVVGTCSTKDIEKVTPCLAEAFDYNNEEAMLRLSSQKFDAVIDVASSTSKRAIETQSINNNLKRGGLYKTSNAELINKIDEDNNLMMGTLLGAADLFAKKLRFWRSHGINYDWVFFNPSGRQLINISNWINEGKISTNLIEEFHYKDFVDAAHFIQTQNENENIPTKKVILKFKE